MERAERDGGLLLELCAPALSGMERAGVFAEIWRQGLLEYDKVVGIDWAWLAADGAMTKAPLVGKDRADLTIEPRGRSVRFSARERGSRSGWRTTVPTATTRSC